jgi:TPM domain
VAIDSLLLAGTAAIVGVQLGGSTPDEAWARTWRWTAIVGSAVVALGASIYAIVDPDFAPAEGSQSTMQLFPSELELPTFPSVPSTSADASPTDVGSMPNVTAQPTTSPGPQAPFNLRSYVTDYTGDLSEADRAAVESAVDQLHSDEGLRLWVVYVDEFDTSTKLSLPPSDRVTAWAQDVVRLTGFDESDGLLAVATQGREYSFLIPSSFRGLTDYEINSLRVNEIEPRLRLGDWAGAALAATHGLQAAMA